MGKCRNYLFSQLRADTVRKGRIYLSPRLTANTLWEETDTFFSWQENIIGKRDDSICSLGKEKLPYERTSPIFSRLRTNTLGKGLNPSVLSIASTLVQEKGRIYLFSRLRANTLGKVTNASVLSAKGKYFWRMDESICSVGQRQIALEKGGIHLFSRLRANVFGQGTNLSVL